MTHIHLNRMGPSREIHRESLGVRWCFACRERHEFVYTVTAEIEPSYYDPSPSVRCTHCGTPNGDCGFGRERIWD